MAWIAGSFHNAWSALPNSSSMGSSTSAALTNSNASTHSTCKSRVSSKFSRLLMRVCIPSKTFSWMTALMYIASSLVKGVPYKIFICLKSVDLPDSPAPRISSLILRDSAAQLWVSERESCGWGIVSTVTRSRRWRGTSCEHAIAAARGGGHARRARARVWAVGVAAARRARERASSKDAGAYLAVALAPAAVVFRNRRAAAHVCATWMLLAARAVAVAVFAAARRLSVDVSRLLLASAAPAGLVTGRRQDAQGAAQAGGKTLRLVSH